MTFGEGVGTMATSQFDLSGRVVVLTGATGLIGRSLALGLLEAGAALVLASRDQGRCDELARSLSSEPGAILPVAYDQGDARSVQLLHDRAIAHFGRIDGLVNNALQRSASAEGHSAESWMSSMRVNGTGTFFMHDVFLEVLAQSGRGSVVNIGSIHGVTGPTTSLYDESTLRIGPPDYYFHKAGMLGLTRYYAATMGPRGVRVNYVAPGGILNDQDPQFVERYSTQTFLGRMGDASELSGVVIFLLSDASQYVTGASICVDGGYTAH